MKKLLIMFIVLLLTITAYGQVMISWSDYNVDVIGGIFQSIEVKARVEVRDGITSKYCVFRSVSQEKVIFTIVITENQLIDFFEKLEELKTGGFNLECNHFDKFYTINPYFGKVLRVGFTIKNGVDLQWYFTIDDGEYEITLYPIYDDIHKALSKAKEKLKLL